MIIRNKEELSISEMRKKVLDIVEVGIESVNPRKLISNSVRYNNETNSLTVHNQVYDIISGRIFVIGGGKAAGFMAEEIENKIGADNITAGILTCRSSRYNTKKIKVIKAEHPIPDKAGILATEKMLRLRDEYDINEKDLVICLISGGASAMVTDFVDGVSLKDSQDLTRLLLDSNADIREINAIRKHISKIKGGKMGRYFAPAKVVSLIISDVVGDDMSVIGSGLTEIDTFIFRDVRDILKKHGLYNKIPKSIHDHIDAGCDSMREETAKKLDNCDNYLIANNNVALEQMSKRAQELGLKSMIASSDLTGESGSVAIVTSKILEENYSGYDVIILGGETIPNLPINHGKGGRNQHYALTTLLAMKGNQNNWVMASVATDGVDYVKNVGGVIIDNYVYKKVSERGLDIVDSLKEYDSNTFFKKLKQCLIKMNDTGTNVGDIVVYLLEK
jgi:glycerate 2-kinase